VTRRLLSIVEGQGDEKAVSVLVRRILQDHGHYDIKLLPPQRRGEYPTVVKNFENYFLAAIKEKAPILWILDFDAEGCDCPYQEAATLLARAQELRAGWPIRVAFLVKEYEVLFLHDEQATRKVFTDIPKETAFPAEPESIRDAKGWLSQQRPRGCAYKETVHQEKITAHLDLGLLRERSGDFVHLERAVLHLIDAQLPA
jgi:hypothetical protein